MASTICSNCGIIGGRFEACGEIRGHDYPCPFNLWHRRQERGIVAIVAKGNRFDGIEAVV